MKIPVLTYHSINVNGTDYAHNDHIAFERDLQLIRDLKINVISLQTLYLWLTEQHQLNSNERYVALTFDDGSELDYRDWNHPQHGFLKSFYTCLKDYPDYHATSFVIASPEARKELEKTCLAGFELWGDDWWQSAEDSGQISVENHSWDHLHATLSQVAHSNNEKGDFSKVRTLEDATAQIAQANDYIDSQVVNKNTQFFAYPYGHVSRYLAEQYFEQYQTQIKAAFSCGGDYVSPGTKLWNIPRFVCGEDWKNQKSLEKILAG